MTVGSSPHSVGRAWNAAVGTRRGRVGALTLILITLVLPGCAQSQSSPEQSEKPAPATVATTVADQLPPLAYESALPEALRDMIGRPFTGDLDAMEARRMIRVGVTYNHTHYFVDRGSQRGLTFAYLKRFEDQLNTARRTGNFRIQVIAVPMARDRLLPALTGGQIDAVAAQWTVTQERQQLVDFSLPYRTKVNEIVVTAPGVPVIKTVQDLSGREVFVRPSSSYAESLRALNQQLATAGRPPVTILDAPEALEDDDILDMVNASLVDITVVDDYLAEFWSQILTDMRLEKTVALRPDADLALAFRQNSPLLKAEVDRFVRGHALGTEFGNIIARRYVQNPQLVRRATSGADRHKFLALVDTFRKYGEQYRLDYLLMMAKGYQESRLDQSVRSRVGAIGIMQIMPATGKALNVGDINKVGPNIHAGVKYTRKLMDEYLGDEPLDELNKGFFTLASYNAGPSRVRQLRREAARRGFDPNQWFGNVEEIASERIGRETVNYVSNIYKYYIAYRLVSEESQRRAIERARLKGGPG
jgi:membrane-bound lytic murein transglycosylase MltF